MPNSKSQEQDPASECVVCNTIQQDQTNLLLADSMQQDDKRTRELKESVRKEIKQVVMISPEVVPFSKIGGLGDVMGALPAALQSIGINTSVITFLYDNINREKYKIVDAGQKVTVILGDKQETLDVYTTTYKNVRVFFLYHPVYSYKSYLEFIEHERTFKEYKTLLKKNVLYPLPSETIDDVHTYMHKLGFEQEMALSKGALEVIIAMGLMPDVIHVHDWQVGFVPFLMKRHSFYKQFFGNVGAVFTIHNIDYQGIFNKILYGMTNIDEEFSIDNCEFYGDINSMKTGIVFADEINTVSNRYAYEITTPDYGAKVDGVLRYIKKTRDNLSGILNGVDYESWLPQLDYYLEYLESLASYKLTEQFIQDLEKEGVAKPVIEHLKHLENYTVGDKKKFLMEIKKTIGEERTAQYGATIFKSAERLRQKKFLYDMNDLSGKANVKAELQRVFDFKPDPDVMVIGAVGRLTEQKGFNILIEISEELAKKNVQFVILGRGHEFIENMLKHLSMKFREKFSVKLDFNLDVARLIMAGSDAFIMFSRYEPCGLTQMYSMARGVLPIVRGTGGLADTVEDNKTGFVFEKYAKEEALKTIERAMDTYYNKKTDWQMMIQEAMRRRFTWEDSALKYAQLFVSAKQRAMGNQ